MTGRLRKRSWAANEVKDLPAGEGRGGMADFIPAFKRLMDTSKRPTRKEKALHFRDVKIGRGRLMIVP
jgi:hypothetical protein